MAYIRLLQVLVVTEVTASFAVWHGTPSDWKGEPLHFWRFEMLRLQYWVGFAFAFAALWLIGWVTFRRFSAKVIPAVLGLLCSLGIELMTSHYFSKMLASNRMSYLGLTYGTRWYIKEHFVSWAVLFTVFTVALWWMQRRKKPST